MKSKKKRNLPTLIDKAKLPEPFSAHTCQNCGYVFEGNFCPSCGQSVKDFHQPIRHFAEDLFGSVFSLDIRLIRTIPILLFHPGRLSAEYIGGKRASFVAPFKLYFFVSLIFFFLIGWQTRNAFDRSSGTANTTTDADSISKADTIKKGLNISLNLQEQLQSQLADTTLTANERKWINRNLKTLENRDLLISRIYQYVSWSLFVLMPLFAFILYLFFHKKRRFYAEHLIYSVNLHTFFFLVAIVALLISMIVPGLLNKIGWMIFLFTIVYSVLGIRNFYRTRWRSAVFSSLGIFFLYFFLVLVVLVGVVLLVVRV